MPHSELILLLDILQKKKTWKVVLRLNKIFQIFLNLYECHKNIEKFVFSALLIDMNLYFPKL